MKSRKRLIKVLVEIPDDEIEDGQTYINNDSVAEYVRDALQSWGSGSDPDDELFAGLKVYRVTLEGIDHHYNGERSNG